MSISEETARPVSDEIFKMYDIRGIAHDSLRVEDLYQIGQSFGTVSLVKGVDEVVVACDARESSPKFTESLIEGIQSTGCSVVNVGMVPTPVMYFAAHHLQTGTGLMVTASHNPPEYNGVKMMLANHFLHGPDIQQLKHRINRADFLSGDGRLAKKSVVAQYSDAICSDIQLKKPVRVVLDCANGIGGRFAPEILRKIGCEVVEMYCDVDNTFPNHPADPTVEGNLHDLIEKVQLVQADVGLALDGDADRMVAVSPSGEIIWPDRLMILFVRDILKNHPKGKVVFDVKCTRSLPVEIAKAGGVPIMWKTGHSLMKSKLRECEGIFGGEMSGHFFFNDRWPGFDDGIYASARLCELIANSGESSRDLFESLPKLYSTPEIRIHHNNPHKLVEQFKKQVNFSDATVSHLDGIRADFEDGFGLMRSSNTASEIVMRFEADSMQSLARIERIFKNQMITWIVQRTIEPTISKVEKS